VRTLRGEFTERVLDLVEQIPPGKVLSYGEVAAILEQGFGRAVGTVLAREGAAVPWWRVVRKDGTITEQLVQRAVEHWAVEGTPHSPEGRVDMAAALWNGPYPT